MSRAALLALLLLFQDPKQGPAVLDKPEDHGIGKKIGPSALVDGWLKDRKACVIAFTATDCPVSKLYRPKLGRLAADFESKGVRLAIVHCNYADAPGEGATHDQDGALAALLGGRRTTDAFVVDAARVLRYRGAIDDQYGIGYQRESATANYLVDAVDAVLAGQAVKIAATEAPGCAIEREPKSTGGAVTYHRDVEPIFQQRCQECHRPGEVGPFPLLAYDKAKSMSKRIKEVVTQRLMPPWHADPKHGAWENDRRLGDREIETISKWVDAGCPKGDAKDAPPPRVWKQGWRIGEPDAVFTIPKPQTVPAEGTIPYRYIRVKTDLKEDKWVQAIEVRPGARAVVHHILVFVEFPAKRFREQPPIDGGLFNGYFAVMVPGEQPMVFPKGTGKMIPAGAHLIFQIHYTATGEETKDQSSVGVVWAKEKPEKEVITRGIINQGIRIPPGAENHREEASWRLPYDAKILALMPHMHVRGKAFKYVAIAEDGKEEVLLDVPRYDFNWQTTYRFKEPKLLKKGTRIKAIAHYDNSKKNPANPDPAATVHFGDQTWDEMLNGYVDLVKAE